MLSITFPRAPADSARASCTWLPSDSLSGAMESRVRLFAASLCRLVLVAMIALAGATAGNLGDAFAAAVPAARQQTHIHAPSPMAAAHAADEAHAAGHGTARSHDMAPHTSHGQMPEGSHHQTGSTVDCCLSFCFPGLASDFVDGFDHLSAAQPESDHEVRLKPQPPHLTDRPPRA
ncbi:hypothetical protein [Stappia indica]|uniref:hypothetical protein n=1 Tax=Stappia indica TaxID=538381 RepID=UPI001D17E6B2|nr:hypothetical protein [Stappia indica]MCC4247006.1 hypothetical protein [Stappia indica]